MIVRSIKFASGRRQIGMTLVEVLVTLVSTSVGLLGVAALQLVSLRNNQAAYVQMQASALASSMLDRIRINPQGFINTEYDNVAFNAMGVPGARSGADLESWQSEIDRLLPGGMERAAGAVQRTPGANIVTVTIRWGGGEHRAAQEGGAITLQMRTEI